MATVYLLYFLLFSRYDKEAQMTATQTQAFVWLHLPLHLSLLLCLQGLRRLITWPGLINAGTLLITGLDASSAIVTGRYAPTGEQARDLQRYYAGLAKLGLHQPAISTADFFPNGTLTGEGEAKLTEFVVTSLQRCFQAYDISLSRDLNYRIQEIGTEHLSDEATQQLFNTLIDIAGRSCLYMLPTLGGVLLLSAIVSVVHRKPKGK